MRMLLCLLLIMAMFVTVGCFNSQMLEEDHSGPDAYADFELRGPHFAKLNTVGCLLYDDFIMTKSGNFDTIDNLVKEKRCFALPTNKVILITGRAKGEIVNAKIQESGQVFYTDRRNLILQ